MSMSYLSQAYRSSGIPVVENHFFVCILILTSHILPVSLIRVLISIPISASCSPRFCFEISRSVFCLVLLLPLFLKFILFYFILFVVVCFSQSCQCVCYNFNQSCLCLFQFQPIASLISVLTSVNCVPVSVRISANHVLVSVPIIASYVVVSVPS